MFCEGLCHHMGKVTNTPTPTAERTWGGRPTPQKRTREAEVGREGHAAGHTAPAGETHV